MATSAWENQHFAAYVEICLALLKGRCFVIRSTWCSAGGGEGGPTGERKLQGYGTPTMLVRSQKTLNISVLAPLLEPLSDPYTPPPVRFL